MELPSSYASEVCEARVAVDVALSLLAVSTWCVMSLCVGWQGRFADVCASVAKCVQTPTRVLRLRGV